MPEVTVLNSAIKVIFLVHMVFATWGIQADWAPSSYIFYNLLLMAILIWAMHQKDSEEAVVMALATDIVCIFLDVITIGMFFPVHSDAGYKRFSAGMAIVNLLLRPVSALFLYRILQERHGLYGDLAGPNLAAIFGNRRGPYEDIDRPSQPIPQPIPQPSLTEVESP